MSEREVWNLSLIHKPYGIIQLFCSLLTSPSEPANSEHQIPHRMSAKVPLSSWWCLIRNELVISFPDSQSASEYQRANPEGRILSQANREVYLPRPQGLIAIRCSSQSNYSLVLEFASEEETMAWHTKVLISSVFSAYIKTRAYIPREVKIDKFLPGGLVCNPQWPSTRQHTKLNTRTDRG